MSGEPPKKDVICYEFKANDYWVGIEEGRQIERAARKQRVRPPDGLLNAAEAAARLGCSLKTLKGHVASGALKYVVLGHGRARQRRMFTAADLDSFIADQSRRDAPTCPSTKTRARRTGSSTSNGEVIAFTAQPRPRPGAKPKR